MWKCRGHSSTGQRTASEASFDPALTTDPQRSLSLIETLPGGHEVMMRLPSPALLLTLALAAPVLAEAPRSAGSTYDSYAMEQIETVTATVQSINPKTRHVTLSLPDGKKQTFAVDPQVKNLEKVKRGDQVVVN